MLNNDKNGSVGGYSYITSRANPLIVATAALSEKKYRDRYGYFVFEGRKLFAEALSSEAEIVNVFICDDIPGNIVSELPSDKVIVVNRSVYDKISREKSPEGILCVAKHIDFLHKFVKIYNCNGKASGTKFMAVQIRDPGNLGTMIRNANALGIDELIISSDCADIYNRRTVRAAMGALFRQKITVCSDIPSAVEALRKNGYRVNAASLSGNPMRLTDMNIDSSDCFLVGNEGHGLSEDLIGICDRSVIIPMREGSESLNAAAAAAILMWETGKRSWIL